MIILFVGTVGWIWLRVWGFGWIVGWFVAVMVVYGLGGGWVGFARLSGFVDCVDCCNIVWVCLLLVLMLLF